MLQAGVIGRRLDEIKCQFGITTPRLCRPPSRRWRVLHQGVAGAAVSSCKVNLHLAKLNFRSMAFIGLTLSSGCGAGRTIAKRRRGRSRYHCRAVGISSAGGNCRRLEIPMFVTLVAVLCRVLPGGPGACVEEI